MKASIDLARATTNQVMPMKPITSGIHGGGVPHFYEGVSEGYEAVDESGEYEADCGYHCVEDGPDGVILAESDAFEPELGGVLWVW